MGIAGSVIGCGTVMFFWNEATIDPISGKGFIAATLGAFMLLFFYRLLAGSFINEGSVHDDADMHRTRQRARKRRMRWSIFKDAA